jgi:hypothetical protein
VLIPNIWTDTQAGVVLFDGDDLDVASVEGGGDVHVGSKRRVMPMA